MHRYLFPIFAAAALQAGMTDFHTLSNAKAAYEKGDYSSAEAQYGALQGKNDQARFNYGDALYKQKKYKEAAAEFSQISDPALKQKALHNLGNSLALEGKTGDAIKAYEEALKLGDDKDTRYNLDLLKKQKEQQQHKDQQQDQDQQQKNDQNQQNQQSRNKQEQQGDQQQNSQNAEKQDNKQNRNQEQNEENRQNQGGQNQNQPPNDQRQNPGDQKQQDRNNPENQKENETKPEQARKGAEKAPEQKQNDAQAQAATAEPISDMEERKYNNMLDQRGIKTLMIPLSSGKGEPHEDETTPW